MRDRKSEWRGETEDERKGSLACPQKAGLGGSPAGLRQRGAPSGLAAVGDGEFLVSGRWAASDVKDSTGKRATDDIEGFIRRVGSTGGS